MKIGSLFIVIIFSIRLYSQELPYINYNTHNGLPQIQVREIYQDKNGYIWVGTKGGLARFNGEHFATFLPNEYIRYLGEDVDGNLMVMGRTTLYRLCRGEILPIAEVPLNSRYISGKSQSFWIYTEKEINEYRCDTLFKTINYFSDIPDDSISSAIFITDENKLLYTTRKNRSIFLLTDDNSFERVKTCRSKIQVGRFDNNNWYLAYIDGGTFSYINPDTNEEYFHYLSENGRIKNISVNRLPVRQFIVFEGFDYYMIDSLTNRPVHLNFPFIKAPWPVIMDKDRNFWVGSDHGLYHVSNVPIRFYPASFMDDFWTIISGNDGLFYGATYQKGLYCIDFVRQTKKEIFSYDAIGNKDSLYYYGASKDEFGNLYFPTHNGIVKYDYLKTKKFNTGISLFSKFDPLSKRIIIGQQNGIAFIDKNGNIERHTDSTFQAVRVHPTSIEPDSSGRIWVGTWNTFALFNRSNGSFSQCKKIYPDSPDKGVISLTTDHRNNLWVGGSNGLWHFDSSNDRFTRIGETIFKTYISSIVSPDSSKLLIGTSHEIYVLNLFKFYQTGTTEFKLFNFRNGYIGQETSQNGFLVDDTLVYIPSSTITSVIDFRKVQYKHNFFNVLITSLNRKGLTDSERKPENHARCEKNVSQIEIGFEGIGFDFPRQYVYSYQLEGIDTEWSNWTEQKTVYYSNLASGTYRFKVRARSGSIIGSESIKESSINIKVTLDFFREPYFYKVALGILVALTIITITLIILKFKSDLKALDREKHLKHFEVATLQAQLNPHFISNILSTVQGLISNNDIEKANQFILKLSRLMRSYMESSIRTSEENNIKQAGWGTVADEMELLTQYMELEKLKYHEEKFKYSIVIENESIKNFQIPPMLVQPFLENSLKHGILNGNIANGFIEVRFEEGNNTLVCSISDNGIGLSGSEKLKKDSANYYKSRGIELVRKRIAVLKQMGIHIDLEFISPERGGTIVKISIFE